MKAKPTWDHDLLADDLAAYLSGEMRMVWTNMQLGPSGSVRPDVYTINRSFKSPHPTAYECKISVSDFRSDVTSGKWTSYQQYAYAVVFAAPAGLISKADVPEACGLILRHENAWRYAKKAVVNPRTIPEDAWVKLLIDGVNREGPKQRAARWHSDDHMREFSRRFGVEAARYVGDAAQVHQRIAHGEDEYRRIIKRAETDAAAITELATVQAPALWRELRSVLGLDDKAGRWDVDREIRELRKERAATRELRELRELVRTLRRISDSYAHWLEDETKEVDA